MAVPNYMTQDSNGMVSINCNGLPDKGFIDAVKTKDIVKFKIMSRQDKASSQTYRPGGPDVIVKDITGGSRLITRKELASKYVHASGNKIKMSILKDGQFYLAYNKCNENYKIMKLPNNCTAVLPDGTKVKPGSYIVARADENGQIDKSTLATVNPNIFKKMFRVPMQDVIRRHMGNNDSKTRKMFTLFNRNRNNMQAINRQVQQMRPRFNSSEIGMNPSNINIGSVNDVPKTPINTTWTPTMNLNRGNTGQKPMQRQQATQSTNNQSHYKYRVTAKLTDIEGRMLGFVVQEIATGKVKNLKVNELTQLCMSKLVENVMVVRNNRGNMYLKGNGCSIESLPKVIA